MKTPKAPVGPDPNAVSSAQTTSNNQTAQYQNTLDHANTVTPWGSQNFTPRVDPTTGATVYDQQITLSEPQQQLLQQQQQQDLQLGQVGNHMISGVRDAYGQPMDTSGAPERGTLNSEGLPQMYGADDLEGSRQAVSDALYQRQSAYLDPQYADRERELTTRLANQGVVEGSEAWRNARDQFGRERTFDYNQARTSSIAGGLSEMQGLNNISRGNRGQAFGERGAEATFANQSRAQALEEMIAQRNQPMNEFNALRSSTQVQTPQFQNPNTPTVAPTDVSGNIWNAYNGQLGIYNAATGSNNSMMGGLMGLGGQLGSAWIGASDARVKSKVKRIGLLPQGVGVYSYEYDGDPQHERHTGVMAQEIEHDDPEAVVTDEDGVKKVDYSRVLAKALAEAA